MTVKSISVKNLARKVIEKERLFILDVRNTSDFDDWKIEGDNVDIINKPYFDLMEGIDSIMEELPKEQPIYVICAKSGSSEFVAEQIVEAGYNNVYYVEGGMKAWSEHLEIVKIGDIKNSGAIYQFVRIGKGCLSYLVESDGKGAIIDTNRMLDQYNSVINEKNIRLTHVLDTHLHADHISGGLKLAQEHDAKYYLPLKDAGEVTFKYNAINDGDEYKVGDTTIKAIYSPGHTIGSISFVIDDQYLLTGDILFIDSIGRPDLAGKAEDWVNDLRTTLYKRYKELGDELLVLPAHYMNSKEMNNDGSISQKLGKLYQENHGLKIADEGEFRKIVTENLPPQPNSYQEIRNMNMGKILPEEEKQREMEIGPNRCAVR